MTDARSDGKVWDMYSGTSNFDFGTHQDKGSGGKNEGEYYNREHSWPNSWFGGKVQPMYKGDFARTYFYMVTCYEEKLPDWYAANDDVRPTIDGSKYPGLTAWQLKMLMEWAKIDPVSEKETNRNNAVYGIQNNRNPFIDYPGLEDYIWGDKKDEAFSYDHYGTTAIMTVEAKGQAIPSAIFSPDGRRQSLIQRGLNILLLPDGRATKIIR